MAGLTLLVYLPAVAGGFVWDDNAHVTEAGLRSLAGLKRIWFEVGATQQYYPLLHSAFWIEHRLWGDAVIGYHLMNILLHAAAASLVVAVMRKLALPGALLAGLIFAVHPVCVESVAWISEQKNTLSAVFYLVAALLYLDYDSSRRPARYWQASAVFVLALLTKTVTATLPAALLVVFWWQRGKIDRRQDVRPLVPWFALGAAAGLFSAWVERNYIGAHGQDFALSLLQRGLLAGRVIWFYLGKLVWPADLVFIYPHWNVDASAWWQYLFPAGIAGLLVLLGWRARRDRGPLAGFLIFAGTLFPVLGFVNVFPFKYSYVADHFQYLASLGVIVPVAAGVTRWAARLGAAVRWPSFGAAALLVAALGILSWRQCGMYRDVVTLYRVTLERNPECSMAHNNLGELLHDHPDRAPEAMEHFAAALRADPRNAEAHNNLGFYLARTPGKLPEAIMHFETALRIRPEYWEAHSNLAEALAKIPGRMPEAVAHYQAAVRLNPEASDPHANLGMALLRMPGRTDDGIAELETAVRLDPQSASSRNNLGVALSQIPGRWPEATEQFVAAVRLNPGSTEMRSNLAAALAQDPARLAEAVAQFEAVVRLAPDSAEFHYNLGVAMLRLPARLPDAVAQLRIAAQIKPDFAEAHQQLGAALMKIPGSEPEAIDQLSTALRLSPDNPDCHYLLGLLLCTQPGRKPEALTHFEQAVRLRPDFASAREWVDRLRTERP